MSLAKCCLFRCQVDYLSHIVSEEGAITIPSKFRRYRSGRHQHRPRSSPSSLVWLHVIAILQKMLLLWLNFFMLSPRNTLVSSSTMPGSVQQTQASCFPLSQCWFTHWAEARWFWTLMQVTLKLVPYCRRFSNAQRELLAVVEFASHFRQYLLGCAFIVCLDHSSLRWLTRMKETEGHLARRLERFGEYNFEIIYRRGWLHSNADSLSRKTSPRSCPCRLPSPPPCPESIGLQLMRCQQHYVVGQPT